MSAESHYDTNVGHDNIDPAVTKETSIFAPSGTKSYADIIRSNGRGDKPNSVGMLTSGTEKKDYWSRFIQHWYGTTFNEKQIQDLQAIRNKRCKLSEEQICDL